MIKHKQTNSQLLACVLIILGIASLAGCCSHRCFLARSHGALPPAHGFPRGDFLRTKPSTCPPECHQQYPWPNSGSPSQLSERFLALARTLSEANDPRSTDYYFQATTLAWQAVAEQSHGKGFEPGKWQIYQTSLAGLITEANRFGRIEQGNLRIHQPNGPRDIPLVSSGLPLPVEELSELQVVTPSRHNKLKHQHSAPGLGVPVVAIRNRQDAASHDLASHDGESTLEQFLPPSLPFAATIILRPQYGLDAQAATELPPEFVLDLANPLQVTALRVGDQELPIARDLSAPLEKLLELRPSKPITGFLLPGAETSDEGLKWLEPYQPGKIPVVFVHGLLSDASTWLDMINDLRTHAWFNERYQVWGFNYATGSPFVTSALTLRTQLREARCLLDPDSQDAALEQMVLVGHSMGGLVAKLQVTDSENRIWDSLARVPLDSLQASEEAKQTLAQRLYFTSQPFVTRVVYIATPHKGSSFAVRGIGRISSALVRPDELQQARHRQLINDNPDAFYGTFRRRIPTSIDLLEPNDCTLQAIFDLRLPGRVEQHTILGTGRGPLNLRRSDGVVSFDSAHHPDSLSKACVSSSHTEITRNEDTISEVTRILQLHLTQSVVLGP